jgi:uroporphyrinogen decarboxylase
MPIMMPCPDRKPDFKRLHTALMRRGEADFVPLFELSVADIVMTEFMGRPVHDPTRIGITLTPPPVDEALSYLPGFIAFYAAAGYDFVPIKFGIGGQVMVVLESGYAGGSRKVRTTHADTSREWAAEEGGFITSWADLEEFPWPEPGTVRLDLLDAAAQLLPDGMRLIGVAGGMLMHARVWMGMQRFWLTLGEDPELAVALLEKLQALQILAIDRATDRPGLGALLLDDDLAHSTGLLENPGFLRAHVFPFYQRVGEIVHSKGLPLIMHTDGRVDRIIPDLVACGLDALHPIEPKAMDIVAVKHRYGDRLALLGNIDVDLLARGNPREIRGAVQECIREVAPGGGFAIGSSNSVPDYVPIENYRALVEASQEFGRQPLWRG